LAENVHAHELVRIGFVSQLRGRTGLYFQIVDPHWVFAFFKIRLDQFHPIRFAATQMQPKPLVVLLARI
jgi:hypothetical protein